jgi:hypothetical protein
MIWAEVTSFDVRSNTSDSSLFEKPGYDEEGSETKKGEPAADQGVKEYQVTDRFM